MYDLYFGIPSREEGNVLVITPKSEYSSMEKFAAAALAFLDAKYKYEYWAEFYQGHPLIPVDAFETRWELSGLDREKQPVHVILEPVLRAFQFGPHSWDDITWCLETEEDYIFYNWYADA